MGLSGFKPRTCRPHSGGIGVCYPLCHCSLWLSIAGRGGSEGPRCRCAGLDCTPSNVYNLAPAFIAHFACTIFSLCPSGCPLLARFYCFTGQSFSECGGGTAESVYLPVIMGSRIPPRISRLIFVQRSTHHHGRIAHF